MIIAKPYNNISSKYKIKIIFKDKIKSSIVSTNRPGQIFLSTTRPHSPRCNRIYFFLFKKKTHTHTNKNKNKLKKRKKKTKGENDRKMSFLWTVSVENLTGYDNIICKFALCTFNLRDQETKWESVLKNTRLWKIFPYICLL